MKNSKGHSLPNNCKDVWNELQETSGQIIVRSRELEELKWAEQRLLKKIVAEEYKDLIESGLVVISVNRRKL